MRQLQARSPAALNPKIALLSLVAGVVFVGSAMAEPTRAEIQQDAQQLLDIIERDYAYRDRFPENEIPVRGELENQIPLLGSRSDLIEFSERALHALYDHHSITGTGSSDAYGLVPSFADLWIELSDDGYEIVDVRQNSPASDAGILPGCMLKSVAGLTVDDAVAQFLGAKAIVTNSERQAYAARVLAAGRRDRVRRLVLNCNGLDQAFELPNLYQAPITRTDEYLSAERVETDSRTIGVIRFNDSLGETETISAFDEAIDELGDIDGLILDLRDTASGGNTLIARGILSRFVDDVHFYQRHILPNEEREHGVVRSWQEEVSPRGETIRADVAVLSGRWTASMGEGLTIAFDALGAETFGAPMAGLLGAISERRLSHTDLAVRLTTEQLTHVNGTPREDFIPEQTFDFADAPDMGGKDGVFLEAVNYLENLADAD